MRRRWPGRRRILLLVPGRSRDLGLAGADGHQFAVRHGVHDLLDLLLLILAAVGLRVAGDAHAPGRDGRVADHGEPADHVALLPAHALDVEEGEVDLVGLAAPRTGLVVVLLGLADGPHVLAGGVDAHDLNCTLRSTLSLQPGILARGPWPPDRVSSHWIDASFEPAPEKVAAADRAIAALRDRGSPAHDGTAARLERYAVTEQGLEL